MSRAAFYFEKRKINLLEIKLTLRYRCIGWLHGYFLSRLQSGVAQLQTFSYSALGWKIHAERMPTILKELEKLTRTEF